MKYKTKDEFIANYLENDRRLKNCKLPYGMAYLTLVGEVEEDAERKWNNYKKRYSTTKVKG